MTPTDTSERELETLIVRHLTTHGYALGTNQDYQTDVALDVGQLLTFLHATQPDAVSALGIADPGIARTKFLHRLQGEITKRGVVTVLRHGIEHGSQHLDLYKTLPTPGNAQAAQAFAQNIFSVTRQLRYAAQGGQSLDLVIFVNGLPVLTFELKNSLSKQTVSDAVYQYQTTRSPHELLFQPGRCLAHFAVDDAEARFCAELNGKTSRFLPFNQGYRFGAGNPPNPQGLKTDYLWRDILATESLADLIEHYAQVLDPPRHDAKTGRSKSLRKAVFPRFHQLRTVRALLRRAQQDGVGQRYLIQHSAGSGKSNTIAWLAHQLVGLRRQGDAMVPQFDSIIVITDRRALDAQIAATIKGHDHVESILAHSDNAEQLRRYLQQGKKIIVTTVQKFPFVLENLHDLSSKNFALLIDEAHSSQGGKITAKMHQALSGASGENPENDDFEDDATQATINAEIERRIASRSLLKNASYFAFTATPKQKTLELFGEKTQQGDDIIFGSPTELSYSTKQAIEEGFILDVIAHYTTVTSYYRVVQTVAGDPEFDKAKALKKIRAYVESHQTAIANKAQIMVDHFIEQVIGAHKIGGQARAMIVCAGIARAIDYHREVSKYLKKINSPYQAIVAYSGEFEVDGHKKTEAALNGFASKDIPDKFKQDPYRFLIVANKFLTGFDEPLLHSMYIDKALGGVQAVQTLSRLNRACDKKYDTFVLDFADNREAVQAAFQTYYQSAKQLGETDPNTLHDLKAELDEAQVYTVAQIDTFVTRYLSGAERDTLDPILDVCVARYQQNLNEDEQVKFKGGAKAFGRAYGFLAAILPYGRADWEKFAIFLEFLVPKLPAPRDDDATKGLLETIDMASYRAEKLSTLKISLQDEDAELQPIKPAAGGVAQDAEKDKLSNILKTFHERFGALLNDPEGASQIAFEELPARVAQAPTYQNALQSTDQNNAKLEHDQTMESIVAQNYYLDQTGFFKQYSDNEGFRQFIQNHSFAMTWHAALNRQVGGARQGVRP